MKYISVKEAADKFGINERRVRFLIQEKRIEGVRGSSWILMDYDDIVIHLFSKEDRLFYDLERIWRDGQKVDISNMLIDEAN